ncbi:MAG: hypothetical protein QF565_01680, partial [Arenicellales bacterium]|nr:hypothetical protein [Arenicellales bacterium]
MNLSVFTVFRKPKLRRHGDWPAAECEASEVLSGGQWPWPNIGRPLVQLEQIETAFHEAGHAVVARYFGLNVIQLSIRIRGEHYGAVWRSRYPTFSRRVFQTEKAAVLAYENLDPPHPASLDAPRPRGLLGDEGKIHVALAGFVAAKKHLGYSILGISGVDLKNFHRGVSCCYGGPSGFVPGSSIAFLRDRYLNSCEEILSKPEIWEWVEAVAEAALRSECGVLTGDEIDSL